jgi:hypothetical protein
MSDDMKSLGERYDEMLRLVKVLDSGHCPDCNHRGFIFGPRGGNSTNIECGNLDCRARFNVGQVSKSHHVMFAHRIPKQSEGGADWT